jgi:mono/diheme cytochrome c family protein
LRLPDGGEIPTVPRFSSWYGVEDITRIFRHAYGGLSADDRVARAALGDLLIGEALTDDHTAIERSNRWPLQRYTDAIVGLLDCTLDQQADESDEAFASRCALARQSSFRGGAHPGGGVARLLYSPAMVYHTLRNYGEVLGCRDDSLSDTWCDGPDCVDPSDNFSRCFAAEVPIDGGNPFAELAAEDNTLGDLGALGGTVVIKATWQRVGFGFELPVYDTDSAALADRMGPGKLALWPEKGDRQIKSPEDLDNLTFPTPEDIYTIRTRSGSIFRLTGLHIMTKELRHWQWITLWWSDEPDSDFGADRPESFGELPSPWANYKMCVVTDYIERDADAAGRYDDFPSLAAALATTATNGQPSWCSNPYIERAAGNARTNCIGCHQHAGTRFAEGSSTELFSVDAIIGTESLELGTENRFPANGRTRRRTFFATDYSWAFSRLDDLTELIRSEVEFAGARDERWTRMNGILSAEGDAAAGREVFANTTPEESCVDCHGDEGKGGFGPDLEQVFAAKTEWQALHTVINGRASMPGWGERLTDQQLTDLFTYLSTTFDTP